MTGFFNLVFLDFVIAVVGSVEVSHQRGNWQCQLVEFVHDELAFSSTHSSIYSYFTLFKLA